MRTKLLFFIFLFFSIYNYNAQATSVTISLDGSVNSFVTHAKLFGVTLYMMQNDKTISKSVTDNYGNYSISGKVNILEPIDLLISKPGFISKKVLFDIATLKINKNRADATTLELVEELVIELYELKPGADLNFAKIGYAEKFTWDQPSFIVKPDPKTKNDLDKKVLEAYEKAELNSASRKFSTLGDQAATKKEYSKAISYYDSALVVSPKDTVIQKKKATINQEWEAKKQEESKKREFDIFKEAGDVAFKNSNWPIAENKYNEAAKLYPNDAYIKGQLQKITNEKQKAEEEIKNKTNYDKAIKEANNFVTAKKYDEAITKYNEAIKLQPNQKGFIESEIAKIKGGMSDESLEISVKKDLKTASELANKSKLDEAIKTYRQVEPTISRFSNQALIDKYSKEVKEGIQSVQAKKDSEDQAYKAQLAKAQENFTKGPSFYNVAKNILNSDPMKSKVNEPEVLELKDKIEKMEAYYLEKSKAYKSISDKKDAEALSQLNKAIQNLVISKKIAPLTEKKQLQKSIDSLNLLVKPSPTVNKTVTPTTPTSNSIKLTAPGEIVVSNDPTQTAFNDMFESTEKYKAQPLNQQQRAKDAYEYDNYFNSTLIAERQDDEKNRVLTYANATEMTRKEVQADAILTQYQQEDRKLQAEKEVERQNAIAKQTQEQLSQNIDNWKDRSDYLKIETDRAIQEQYVAQIASIDKNKAQAQLYNESIYSDVVDRQGQQQQRIENIQYANYKQDSLNRNDQEVRSNQIQKLMDYKDPKVESPNNLQDENGVPFEKNKMTERVYKIKNSNDEVIKVIVRRVVVDKSGYGVVFEQITNDSGMTYYTRNGATVPDFIWFNDSTGENVIEK